MFPIKKVGLWLNKAYQKTVIKLNSIKGTPKNIAKGFATGVSMSFTPFVGFHLLLSLVITKLTNQNSTASALGTLAGNPWTFPFIWYATLKTGKIILSQEDIDSPINFKHLFTELYHAVITLDFDAFLSDIWPEFFPMLLGCIPFYIVVWLFTYHFIYRILKNYSKEV